jgi:thiol-disulfide isomerase/thioredoxin
MVSLHACLLALALTGNSDTVLLSFTADWCGHCRVMQPIVQRMVDAGYPVREVNVDHNPDLASQLGVQPLPCFVLLRNGREVDRVIGEASFDRLVQMFQARDATALAGPVAPLAAPGVRGQSPDNGLAPRVPLPTLVQPAAVADLPPARPERLAAAPSVTPPAVPSANASSVHQAALEATVRLRVVDSTGVSHGTGTIVDVHGEEALVLTCGHIFRDSRGQGQILVELFVGGVPKTVPGQLVAYEAPVLQPAGGASPEPDKKRSDIGLVSVRPGVAIRPMRVAPPSYQSRPGEPVFSVGCDHGADPSVRATQITAINRYVGPPSLEIHGSPTEGRSGGGLFSADGCIIGVCNAADHEEDRGIYAGTATIHNILRSINQEQIFMDQSAAAIAAVEPASAPLPTAPVRPVSLDGSGFEPMPAPAAAPAPIGETEVICIVRARDKTGAPDRVLVVDRPSSTLLQMLQQESGRGNPAGSPTSDAAAITARRDQPSMPVPPVIRAQNQ